VPSTNDPPSVSKANKGTTPWSCIPQKPAMMQAMRMTDKTMCEMTADGFMMISLEWNDFAEAVVFVDDAFVENSGFVVVSFV